MPRYNQYGQYSYSCCGRVCHDGDDASQGCLRCDHMDRQPCTAPGHEEARCADLAAFYVRAIPTALFNYGMTRPLNEAVLMRQPSGTSIDDTRVVKYTMPFGEEDGGEGVNIATPLTLGSVARNLSSTVGTSPLMTHIYGIDDQDAEHRKMMQEINDRWPDTCIKKEDRPSESATGGSGSSITSNNFNDTASKISPSVPYIIPFVVICRIKI